MCIRDRVTTEFKYISPFITNSRLYFTQTRNTSDTYINSLCYIDLDHTTEHTYLDSSESTYAPSLDLGYSHTKNTGWISLTNVGVPYTSDADVWTALRNATNGTWHYTAAVEKLVPQDLPYVGWIHKEKRLKLPVILHY